MQSTEDRARPPEELRDEERVPSLPLAGTPPLPALALPWPALRPSQLWLCLPSSKAAAAAVVSGNTFPGCFCLFIQVFPKASNIPKSRV